MTQLLKDTVFYIIPRLNPDGVETILKTGLQGVSNGKYPIEERQPLPGLRPKDINGDRVVAQMRGEIPKDVPRAEIDRRMIAWPDGKTAVLRGLNHIRELMGNM